MLRLIWLLAIFLVGCDYTQESITPTQDDLDRIASILGQDRRPLLASSVTPARTSSLKLSDTRISFADALELGGCGLLPLIAERNSSLGRQKQESTRLIYEWKLKAGLNQCDQLDDQEWFKKALETKAKDVEIAVLQLLTQSEEATRIHLKIPKPFATLTESRVAYLDRSQPVIQFIVQALQKSTPPPAVTITQFEQSLYDWSQTQHHGTLHQAIVETRDWLAAANTLQRATIAANQLCPMGTPTERGRNLQSFVRDFFGGLVQPKLSSVAQAIDEFQLIWSVLPITLWTHDTMVDTMLKLPAGYRTGLRDDLRVHIKNWQLILQSCGLNVRADTTNS
ncbi:MAG: DUF3080 family protein [Pseudomonadota bacterium]|nr:DUF3080 family protein [Pseudomonadota bacterium]